MDYLISDDYILSLAVYLIFLIYSGILFFITVKALRRNIRSRLNQVFAGFFLTMSSSSILLFYILFRDPNLSGLATILAKSMFYIGAIISAGLLFLYTIILLKYEIMSKLINVALYVIIYSGITSGMLFIPNGVVIEVKTDTLVYTIWTPEFFLYFFIVILFLTILTIFSSFKVLKSFNDRKLKHRLSYSIAGIVLFFSYPIFTSILIFFRLSFFLYTIIIVIASFLGISFIYYGLARTLEN